MVQTGDSAKLLGLGLRTEGDRFRAFPQYFAVFAFERVRGMRVFPIPIEFPAGVELGKWLHSPHHLQLRELHSQCIPAVHLLSYHITRMSMQLPELQ